MQFKKLKRHLCAAAVALIVTCPSSNLVYARQQVLVSNNGTRDTMCQRVQPQLNASIQWKVLGPLPAGMRESHVGAFPPLAFKSLQDVFEHNGERGTRKQADWTTLVAGGKIDVHDVIPDDVRESWTKESSNSLAQTVRVQYPDADWHGVRSSMGWAALQWQALGMTTVDITSPSHDSVALQMSVSAAASFALVSEDAFKSGIFADDVTWYNGDWYSYRAASRSHQWAASHHAVVTPGKYYVIVKAVHEVRIHGAGDEEKGPQIEFSLALSAEEESSIQCSKPAPLVASRKFVVPSIVGGNFAGHGLGLSLQNTGNEWLFVTRAAIVGNAANYLLAESEETVTKVAPGQTRPLGVRINQKQDIPQTLQAISVGVSYEISDKAQHLTVDIPITHIDAPEEAECERKETSSWSFTYLDADGTIQLAATIPPLQILKSTRKGIPDTPMTLYVHGAGVDISERGSQQVLNRQCESWIVAPSGRTSWGTDWQGLSRDSINYAAEAFKNNLYGFSKKDKENVRRPSTERLMFVGHSNGGQGVYHYVSHWPDKVLGAAVLAGYTRVADYVPLIWQRGRHFVEGALDGILRSALNPYENTLFASNMAGLPLTIKHGGADDNVPTWHSREMAGLVADWNRNSLVPSNDFVNFTEIPGKPHFWDTCLKEDDIQEAIDARVLHDRNPGYAAPGQLSAFTLTVANPDESGSKQGWRIIRLAIPGRIGRLTIHYIAGELDVGHSVKVRTSNVDSLSLSPYAAMQDGMTWNSIEIDGQIIDASSIDRAAGSKSLLRFNRMQGHGWRLHSTVDQRDTMSRPTDRALGPMIRFLQSYGGPIQLIVPRARCSADITSQYMSVALRFSADALLYSGIDCEIHYDDQVRASLDEQPPHAQPSSTPLGNGNILLLGGPSVNVLSFFSAAGQGVFAFAEESSDFSVKNSLFGDGAALVAIMPDPIDERRGRRGTGIGTEAVPVPSDTLPRMTLMLHGTTSGAIEQAAALLPVRTASMLPEWVVIESASPEGLTPQWKGYGSIVGAGWYTYDWTWNDFMGYLM